jgi:hypothetical protein
MKAWAWRARSDVGLVAVADFEAEGHATAAGLRGELAENGDEVGAAGCREWVVVLSEYVVEGDGEVRAAQLGGDGKRVVPELFAALYHGRVVAGDVDIEGEPTRARHPWTGVGEVAPGCEGAGVTALVKPTEMSDALS